MGIFFMRLQLIYALRALVEVHITFQRKSIGVLKCL